MTVDCASRPCGSPATMMDLSGRCIRCIFIGFFCVVLDG